MPSCPHPLPLCPSLLVPKSFVHFVLAGHCVLAGGDPHHHPSIHDVPVQGLGHQDQAQAGGARTKGGHFYHLCGTCVGLSKGLGIKIVGLGSQVGESGL